jgi:hypothetical protein
MLAATVLIAILAAGCGTSKSASHASAGSRRSAVPIDAPYRGPHPAGLLGGAASAGTAPGYAPAGRIVADSGFRPQVNASMANGHCMGFSVSALRFYTHNLAPQSYGASQSVSLPVQGNSALQSLIAEGFA